MICVVFVFFFFFQAEDGIRDLVRSRGLGDVYKRQDYDFLYKAGVSGVFGPGTVISISAIDILEKLIEKNK